jgi:hypothetical protein
MAKRILRDVFDRLTEAKKTEHIKSGGWVVDSMTQKQASAPRLPGLTIARSRFDKMSPGEQDAIIADGAAIIEE